MYAYTAISDLFKVHVEYKLRPLPGSRLSVTTLPSISPSAFHPFTINLACIPCNLRIRPSGPSFPLPPAFAGPHPRCKAASALAWPSHRSVGKGRIDQIGRRAVSGGFDSRIVSNPIGAMALKLAQFRCSPANLRTT